MTNTTKPADANKWECRECHRLVALVRYGTTLRPHIDPRTGRKCGETRAVTAK